MHFTTAVICTLAGSCTPATGELANVIAAAKTESIAIHGASVNGLDPNGSSINGSLNGASINGQGVLGSEVHGPSTTGANAIGSALNGIALHGSALTTTRATDGAVLTGAALVGATFATHMPDGSRITLRIDAYAASPSEHHTDSTVSHYALSYKPSEAIEWKPVCGEHNHEAVLAIPLEGRWSYEQGVAGGGSKLDEPDWITFACGGFALYKCVELGYEPWISAGGAQLDGHHQACVRAHRADYCGDGRPYTIDGQLINIFDELGIQGDTELWSLESEWDASSARCLSRARIRGGTTPDCMLPRCGPAPDWSNALLVTEAS